MKITTKQLVVLDFIKKYIAEKGYSPTIREICTGLNLKSPGSVYPHIKKLTLAGYIISNPTKSRTIELLVENEYLNDNENIYMIPVINDENIDSYKKEFLPIPKFMLNTYDKKNVLIYKHLNSYYLINTSLKPLSDSLLLVKDDKLRISNDSKKYVIGVVITEIRIY